MRMVMASQFMKINSVFLGKKPTEVNALPLHIFDDTERDMNAAAPLPDACIHPSSIERRRTAAAPY